MISLASKKCSQHCFHLRFLHSHFLSFQSLWNQPSSILTFCFWIVHETPTFITCYDLFKTFLSSWIISTNWTDDAAHWCFRSGINKWAHTSFFFKSSTNILCTVSLLIPVISSHIRTLKVWSLAKHFWTTSIDSSNLEDEGRPFHSSSNDSHSSLNLLCHSITLALDKHSSPYALFNISNVSVAVFFHLTQNLIAALCSILKPWTQQKTDFTKSTVFLICINQTSWNLHIT
jgi:hypothetical protein